MIENLISAFIILSTLIGLYSLGSLNAYCHKEFTFPVRDSDPILEIIMVLLGPILLLALIAVSVSMRYNLFKHGCEFYGPNHPPYYKYSK